MSYPNFNVPLITVLSLITQLTPAAVWNQYKTRMMHQYSIKFRFSKLIFSPPKKIKVLILNHKKIQKTMYVNPFVQLTLRALIEVALLHTTSVWRSFNVSLRSSVNRIAIVMRSDFISRIKVCINRQTIAAAICLVSQFKLYISVDRHN